MGHFESKSIEHKINDWNRRKLRNILSLKLCEVMLLGRGIKSQRHECRLLCF